MAQITTVRLPEDLLLAMAKLHKRDGISTSEMIKRALAVWLEKKDVYKQKKEDKR